MNIIEALTEVLEARRAADPDSSYVASLYARGLNKMLEKVGEEATEVLLAAKDHGQPGVDPTALEQEVADLWFHCMVCSCISTYRPRGCLQHSRHVSVFPVTKRNAAVILPRHRVR